MADLGPVAWPPEPIRTERLVLREPEARDRAAFIELLASPEVGTYLGGSRPCDELEREMPGAPERHLGLFIVDLDGAMIGQIILRRAAGHGPPAAAEQAELGYLFLPEAWGFGYAAEACAAALGWFAGELPGEAGVHRGRAVRSLRRRAVVRHVVPGHAVRLSSCSPGPSAAMSAEPAIPPNRLTTHQNADRAAGKAGLPGRGHAGTPLPDASESREDGPLWGTLPGCLRSSPEWPASCGGPRRLPSIWPRPRWRCGSAPLPWPCCWPAPSQRSWPPVWRPASGTLPASPSATSSARTWRCAWWHWVPARSSRRCPSVPGFAGTACWHCRPGRRAR